MSVDRRYCEVHLQELVSSAVFGVVVSLCCVPPCIVWFTHNVFMAIIATVAISMTCVSVIGLMPLAGFDLGVTTLREFLNSKTYMHM